MKEFNRGRAKAVKDALVSERPASWKEFPDIGLYKDQVVAYISKQLIRFHDEELLTSAMINNYIKDKLLPRADGKKYSKEHLAGLIEICILKQVLSVRNTGFLLNQVLGESNQEIFYERFKEDFDDSLARVAEQIERIGAYRICRILLCVWRFPAIETNWFAKG